MLSARSTKVAFLPMARERGGGGGFGCPRGSKAVALPSLRLVAKTMLGEGRATIGEYFSREDPLAGQATRGWELGGISIRASDTRALPLSELLECTMEVAIYREQDLMHL